MRQVDVAKQFIGECLQPGDFAVDATVGNGHDTLFLAKLVGNSGLVYGFDIQIMAIELTNEKLRQAGLHNQTKLYQTGHEKLSDYISASIPAPLKAVMFNLGYLPGSDKQKITTPETTLSALHTSLEMLAVGGRISVIGYTGHPGGQTETEACKLLASRLTKDFRISINIPQNKVTHPPELILIERIN